MHYDYNFTRIRTQRGICTCGVCKERLCKEGMMLALHNDPHRQLWVCRSCIVEGSSAIVKFHYEIGTLKTAQDGQGVQGLPCRYSCNPSLSGLCKWLKK